MSTLPETGDAQPFESAPFRLDLATASMQKVRKIRAQRELLVTTLQDRKHLAYMRYRGRVDTMLNALNSDQDLFVAELSLAQARPDELLSWSRSTEFSVEDGSNKIWGIWPQWCDPPVSAEMSALVSGSACCFGTILSDRARRSLSL
jgi:hypothetical protein